CTDGADHRVLVRVDAVGVHGDHVPGRSRHGLDQSVDGLVLVERLAVRDFTDDALCLCGRTAWGVDIEQDPLDVVVRARLLDQRVHVVSVVETTGLDFAVDVDDRYRRHGL